MFVLELEDMQGHELKFLPLLSDLERQRYTAYSKQKDAFRFILSKAVSKLIMGKMLGIPATDLKIAYQKKGKPYVLGAESLIQFNVSHTDEMVALALDANPIGVDIESIDNISKAEAVGNKVLSESEQMAIARDKAPKTQFCVFWTRKEALLKGLGKGIDDDIKKVPAIDGVHHIWEDWGPTLPNWNVRSLSIFGGHCCSVAYTERARHRMPRLFKIDADFLLKLLNKALK